MDMKVSLESLYLKHFERVGISIIYAKLNKSRSNKSFERDAANSAAPLNSKRYAFVTNS
jgi:hypothetical protein